MRRTFIKLGEMRRKNQNFRFTKKLREMRRTSRNLQVSKKLWRNASKIP